MSNREAVTIELRDGRLVNGIGSSWNPAEIGVGTPSPAVETFAVAAVKRVSIQRRSNKWKKSGRRFAGAYGFHVWPLGATE